MKLQGDKRNIWDAVVDAYLDIFFGGDKNMKIKSLEFFWMLLIATSFPVIETVETAQLTKKYLESS